MKRTASTAAALLLALALALAACTPAGPAQTETAPTESATQSESTAAPTAPVQTEKEEPIVEILRLEGREAAPVTVSYDLSAPPPALLSPEGMPGDYAHWLTKTEALLDYNEANPYLSASGDSGNYAWGTSYFMQSIYTAYRMTLDPAYMELYAKVCRNMLDTLADNDGDGYLGWGTGTYNDGDYDEFAVHTGLAVVGFANFISLVRADEALSGKYGGLADELESVTNEHLIPSFDRDFWTDTGIYMNRPGSGNWWGRKEPATLPHNQYLGFASALYAMAAVSPEYTAHYMTRAESMAAAFKSFLKTREDGTFYWQYADKFFLADVSYSTMEDYSHAMHDYMAAIDSYNSGGVFSLDDLRAFADNLMYYMINEDFTVSNYVTGGGGYGGPRPFLFNVLLSAYNQSIWEPCAATTPDDGYYGLADAARVLTFHPEAPAPEAVALAAPSAGEAVSADWAIFSWAPGKHASDYCLQISTDEGFEHLAVDRPYISVNAVPVTGLSPDTEYFWRVISRNASGQTAASAVQSFRTGAETETPRRVLTFDISAPAPAEGTAAELTVYINRAPACVLSPFEDGGWRTVELDVSKLLKNKTSATVSFEVAVREDSAGAALFHIDNIALSGSDDPAVTFDDTEALYIYNFGPIGMNLDHISVYQEIGIKDGVGRSGPGVTLGAPPATATPGTGLPYIFRSHFDTGFSLLP